MEAYEVLDKLGEGGFGVVLRARRRSDGRPVAIKKIGIRRLDDGLPKEAFREVPPAAARPTGEQVHALQLLEHPNVIRLHAVFPHGSALALVFDQARTDLASVLRRLGRPLGGREVKTLLWMALHGMAHCHANQLLHRDIKPANMLVGADGELVLADFGLARVVEPPGRQYSIHAATRWYRAPELLFGAREYGPEIDIWSMGCTLGQMLNQGSVIWAGQHDIDQLSRIQRSLGTFGPANWPGFELLPDFGKITFGEMEPQPNELLAPGASPAELSCLLEMLRPDPIKRASAAQLLQSDYFFSEPLPAHRSQIHDELMGDYDAELARVEAKQQRTALDPERMLELGPERPGFLD